MCTKEGSHEPSEGCAVKGGTHPDGCQCMACGTHRTFESLLRQPKAITTVGKGGASSLRVLKEWNSDVVPTRVPDDRNEEVKCRRTVSSELSKPENRVRSIRVAKNASSSRTHTEQEDSFASKRERMYGGRQHCTSRERGNGGELTQNRTRAYERHTSRAGTTGSFMESRSRNNPASNRRPAQDRREESSPAPATTEGGYDPLHRNRSVHSTREEQLAMQQRKHNATGEVTRSSTSASTSSTLNQQQKGGGGAARDVAAALFQTGPGRPPRPTSRELRSTPAGRGLSAPRSMGSAGTTGTNQRSARDADSASPVKRNININNNHNNNNNNNRNNSPLPVPMSHDGTAHDPSQQQQQQQNENRIGSQKSNRSEQLCGDQQPSSVSAPVNMHRGEQQLCGDQQPSSVSAPLNMHRSGSSRSFGRTHSRGKVALRRLNQGMRATHNVMRAHTEHHAREAEGMPLHHTWERTKAVPKPTPQVMRRMERQDADGAYPDNDVPSSRESEGHRPPHRDRGGGAPSSGPSSDGRAVRTQQQQGHHLMTTTTTTSSHQASSSTSVPFTNRAPPPFGTQGSTMTTTTTSSNGTYNPHNYDNNTNNVSYKQTNYTHTAPVPEPGAMNNYNARAYSSNNSSSNGRGSYNSGNPKSGYNDQPQSGTAPHFTQKKSLQTTKQHEQREQGQYYDQHHFVQDRSPTKQHLQQQQQGQHLQQDRSPTKQHQQQHLQQKQQQGQHLHHSAQEDPATKEEQEQQRAYSVPENSEEHEEVIVYPCSTCQRSFNGLALKKHEKICKKVFIQKRKAFDIVAIRKAEGADTVVPAKENNSSKVEKPVSKWRLKSQAFRQAVKQGQLIQAAVQGKGEMPAFQPTPEELDDRTQCPHCLRKFNTEAAKRHIPKCQDLKSKPFIRAGRSSNPGGPMSRRL